LAQPISAIRVTLRDSRRVMLKKQGNSRLDPSNPRRYGVAARLDAGAIVDDVTAGDGRHVSVRFERCPAGWQAAFELAHPEVADLTVVHRLVAESLADARAAVPGAIAYLLGTPVDEPL
jgi:hypothetical protein